MTPTTRDAPPAAPPDTWKLRLYVAGQTSRSLLAYANLKAMCETHLHGRYRIEVIDLVQQPQLAAEHQIFATPTVIRERPEPERRIIGDLSNTAHVLEGLDLVAGDGGSS